MGRQILHLPGSWVGRYDTYQVKTYVYFWGRIAPGRIWVGQWKRGRVKAVVDGRPTYRKQAPATMACFYLTLYSMLGDGLRNNISTKV